MSPRARIVYAPHVPAPSLPSSTVTFPVWVKATCNRSSTPQNEGSIHGFGGVIVLVEASYVNMITYSHACTNTLNCKQLYHQHQTLVLVAD